MQPYAADASSSTGRSTASISANSSGPAMHGGAIWIAGAPRLSAREMSPRWNIAGVSSAQSRSASALAKRPLVAWSFTSSMPMK